MITQEHAIEMLNWMMTAAQKARSNAMESIDGDSSVMSSEWALQLTMPHLFPADGQLGIVNPLMQYADKANRNGVVDPIDFMNALSVAHMDETVVMVYEIYADEELPGPIDGMTELER